MEILINQPVSISDRLERIHLFPGRHLGEEEFDRLQAYADARLAPLLNAWEPGIVSGLDINLASIDVGSEGFMVSPGLAIAGNGQTLGLYYPIRQTWQSLIEDYLRDSDAPSASGVFYLTLRRASHQIDAGDNVDACQRTELDPSRDTRLVVLGTVGLRRLTMPNDAPTTFSRELIENWVVASNVDNEFLKNMSNAVPLGLVAIETDGDTYSVSWFSQVAGRYMATTNSGYVVLLNQVNEAFRRLLEASDEFVSETLPLSDYLRDNLHLDFLPAAGQLPLELLQNPAATTPGMMWLPDHLGIDVVPVPEESVAELIERHMARRVVDLRQPVGDRIRLLLAVNEPQYRRDLLDFPQTDAQLESDLFRYFMRGHERWRAWLQQFNHLYFLREEVNLDADEISALKLPDPVESPQRPEGLFSDIIAKADEELTTPEAPDTPYPYSEGPPAPPGFYTNWLSGTEPPGVADPLEDGLVIRYAVKKVKLEAIDNQIRNIRTRLEKTRDYLMLQRQQLDSQTVSLAALGGGVAGDGSGLQVARWLPYTRFEAKPLTAPPAEQADSTESSPTQPATNVGVNAAVDATFNQAYMDYQPAMEFLAAPSFMQAVQTPMISAMELSLNKQRLERITAAPMKALTQPAFKAKEYRFGVLNHIRPEINEYKMAYRGMAELITTVDGLFDPLDAKSLKAKLRRFGRMRSPDELDALDEENHTGHTETDELNSIQARYEELFKGGQILTKQIAVVEGRYNRIEAFLERKLRERINCEGELEKLAILIKEARDKLEALDKRRIEQLGDYGVARQLLEDDWRQVYDTNQERTRILTKELRGLYYVRVRPTPVSAALADPLEMRYGKASDIVPGCDWMEDPELPDDLTEFFDSVLEVPMDDWRDLRPLRIKMPPIKRIDYMYALRQARFDKRRRLNTSGVINGVLNIRLQSLMQLNQSVLHQWSGNQLPTRSGSLRKFYYGSAQILSLEDILSGGTGTLRRTAQKLHDRLEQCVACLLDKLNELAPSIRLQWAQLAEDDRLPVEHVEQWPGLERAEREDFNATRTTAELIEWWFRQLDVKVSSTGRSAMRNMIRSCLIYAALGDPSEILHGQVHIPPRRFRVGEALRIKLNRNVIPGTALQLLDQQQRVIGLLNVEDHDEQGTLANVVRVVRNDVTINTGFTVVANKLTKQIPR